jgi:Four helix bundle sensory module for signal transduction
VVVRNKVPELAAFTNQKCRSVTAFVDIQSRVNDQRAAARGFVLVPRKEELDLIAKDNQLIAEDFARLESLVLTPKGKQMLAQLQGEVAGYQGQIDRALDLQRAGKTNEAASLMHDRRSSTGPACGPPPLAHAKTGSRPLWDEPRPRRRSFSRQPPVQVSEDGRVVQCRQQRENPSPCFNE